MSIDASIPKPIFKNLQALRGIAALMVCTYHFSYMITDLWGAVAFSHGWLGVQIFFIISGFIMVHTTSKIKTGFLNGAKTFMLNRAIRIIPLYYLCTFILIAPFMSDGYLAENGRHLFCSLFFISPMTSTAGPEYGMPVLEVGWSLNYEMMFYALFTIAILMKNFKYAFLYTIFISLIFVIPFWQAGTFPQSYQSWFPYGIRYINVLTNPILLHFLLGITLGLVMPKIKVSRHLKIITLLLATSLFLTYLTGITGMAFSLWNDLIFCGMLVFSFLLNDYGNNGFRFHPYLVKLGDMSYSVYLLHPIVIIYLKIMVKKAGWEPIILTTGFFIFAIITVIVCSSLFFQVIETRLTRFLKLKLTR